MLKIKPIKAPFFSEIISAEVCIPNYNLEETEPVISIRLYDSQGGLYKEITQPVSIEVHSSWERDNNFLIKWAFEQNGIEMA